VEGWAARGWGGWETRSGIRFNQSKYVQLKSAQRTQNMMLLYLQSSICQYKRCIQCAQGCVRIDHACPKTVKNVCIRVHKIFAVCALLDTCAYAPARICTNFHEHIGIHTVQCAHVLKAQSADAYFTGEFPKSWQNHPFRIQIFPMVASTSSWGVEMCSQNVFGKLII
jgi:hypothetical protein